MSYVIIGGGVAGTACAQTLLNLGHTVVVIAPGTLKILKSKNQTTELLKNYKLDVSDCDLAFGKGFESKFKWIKSSLKHINTSSKTLFLENGDIIIYEKVCFCTGATPKPLKTINSTPMYYLRDVDSVLTLTQALNSIEDSIAIIGSGGISFDLVYGLRASKIKNLYWFYDESKTSEKYFDELALKFLLKMNKKIDSDEILDGCEVFKRKPTSKPTGGASGQRRR